nr:AraC family transcriptional regulator [Aurantimonas sp. VKM B-3413]
MVLSQASKAPLDPLFDVLSTLGARSVRRTRFEAAGDWALAFPALARLKFVAMVRGECWIVLPDRAALRMAAGDVCLIGTTPFVIASDPALEPGDGAPLYADGCDVVRRGGNDCVMLGGGISFDSEGADFLLEMLPPFMHVEGVSPSASAMAKMLGLLEREIEQQGLGGSLIIERLTEVLLVEALRVHLSDVGGEGLGWVGALADRQIGHALRLMHGDVARAFTVADLAAATGMSRSAFSARFTSLVGKAPLEYLRNWRMIRAREMLRQDGARVDVVGLAVGYASQSAFCHAFKRMFGHPPTRGR